MSDSWKRVGGFSRTGTQNYVRNSDATMGGTTFGLTDISRNAANTIMKIDIAEGKVDAPFFTHFFWKNIAEKAVHAIDSSKPMHVI